MKIQILGTAAGEGIPGIFCACDICNKAREKGGKNLRSRSSIQIDDIYKIDFPPDVYYHMIHHGIDLSKLKYLFFSHSHQDHYTPGQIEYVLNPYAYDMENLPLRIFGNQAVVDRMQWIFPRNPPIEVSLLEAFMPMQADHLTFTPIIAEHMKSEECFNYVVQSDSAAVLYACDTGRYSEATIDHLAGCKFDLLMVECTYGTKIKPIESHMNFKGVLELRDRMAARGCVDADTRLIVTHFSHNTWMLHDELEELVRPEGFEVAYDGMMLDV